MATYCIYKLSNMITLMAYVGKTDDFETRKKHHKNPKDSPNMLITKAINKYGWENFKREKLCDNVPLEQLDENFYIERENTRAPNGYNTNRGDGAGTVYYDKLQKKYVVFGPQPDRKFVGMYFNEEKAERARKLFRYTGERMKSDIKTRQKGTGTIRITDSGRYEARIRWKGKPYSKTFDTDDECEAFFIQIKNRFNV
jgi:group I intron endonuclease